MLFALLSTSKNLDDVTDEVSDFFSISHDKAFSLVSGFLNREEPFYSKFDRQTSQFPKNIIISDAKNITPIKYKPEEFAFVDVDLMTQRALHSPRTVVFMPTNVCSVCCAYCYADRPPTKQMEFKQVIDLIDQ